MFWSTKKILKCLENIQLNVKNTQKNTENNTQKYFQKTQMNV